MTPWRCRNHTLPVGGRVLIMGIVNVTPDSFSDGGRHANAEAAVAHGHRLILEGADILDVGGESTRPGAPEVDVEEEARRVVPVATALARDVDVPLSVDTMKADVAEAALAGGASIVNDVTAGTHDPRMFDVVARNDAGLILMHMQGSPRTMQENPTYGDVVADVCRHLAERAEAAEAAGVARERIALDPGFGFGKTLEHNLALLRGLPDLKRLGYPVVVGLSRKSFIGTLTTFPGGPTPPPTDRMEGSVATTALAAAWGADVVRVHDARAHWRAARVAEAANGRVKIG